LTLAIPYRHCQP